MKNKTIHYQIPGMEYLFIKVPTKVTDEGDEYIAIPVGIIEKGIAKKLIESRVPIRGVEAKFLRKTLSLSLKDWVQAFGLSAAGVMKWEKSPNIRLSKVNEAAVRSFSAEKLGINIEGQWSQLIGKKETPKRLSLKLDVA